MGKQRDEEAGGLSSVEWLAGHSDRTLIRLCVLRDLRGKFSKNDSPRSTRRLGERKGES